jgi:short-subunit dehydrogenase
MKVQNKVIVVTGGGGGIGQQLVLNLLERGASVAAVDINVNGLNATKALAGHLSSKLSLHQADISNRESVAQLATEVTSHHGCVDGVINNAGIIHPFKPVNELDHGLIERIINVNLYGVINVTKVFLPLLLERPAAHIANVSSMGGLFAFPNQSIYGASKAAVKLLTEGLFTELRGTNVGVTVIYPGAIATDITKNCGAHSEKFDRIQKQIYGGTSPQTAARCIVDGIERNRFRVIIGVDAKILSFLYRIAPRLTILLVGKIMKMAMSD